MVGVTRDSEGQSLGPSWASMDKNKRGSRASCVSIPAGAGSTPARWWEGRRDLGIGLIHSG